MSVYKPKNSRIWHFDFVIAGRRYTGSTGVLNRRAAEEVERKKRHEVATGRASDIARMTFDLAAGAYFEQKGQDRGDRVDVERRIGLLVRLIGPETPLGDIDQAFVADLIERRRKMTFRKSAAADGKAYAVSNSTVNRDIIETLRPILRRARTHWSPRGVVHGLPEIDWRELRLSEPRALSRMYSPQEKAAWLDACSDEVRLAVEMMLTYGIRFGELFFPLSALNLDPEEPTLTLQKGRKRDVILHLPLRRDHGRTLAARVPTAREAGLDQVWFRKEGDKTIALTYAMLEHAISKAADEAGISGGRRIHGARHHAGSAILKRTKNLKTVQGLLGHSRVSSSERYAHVLNEELRAALEDEPPQEANSGERPADGGESAG